MTRSYRPAAPFERSATRRRSVLKGALGALAGAALAPLAHVGRAATAPTLSDLGGGFALLEGAGGNVLVRSTDEGQVLVDSGAAAFTDDVLAALAELPGAGRVGTLFNTHWHLDQVGSNAALGRAGAAIIAHEKTRVRLATDYYLRDEERYQEALPAEAHPTQSFYTNGATTVGGERIEYGYLIEAHTDGDIYVYFRDSNVMAVGDVVSPVRDPELDWFGGGWLGGRLDSLALLLELTDGDTRFVPSYGPAVGRADVEAEHGMMQTIFDRMFEMIRMGYSAEDMLADGVLEGLGREFEDPFRFVYAAHKSLWAHHNKLSHDIV
ncbi:MAG: MBL fold metallo-hydrolase [Gammaproteobacteria bacterium]|nr:MBL fold metallo-hydrolase [Gammaproteobacteria bacterium]